jgi:NADPH2:quinone reductase
VPSGVGVADLRRRHRRRLVATQQKLDRLDAAGISIDVGLVAGDPAFTERAFDATGGHGFDIVVIDNTAVPRLTTTSRAASPRSVIWAVTSARVNLDEVARKRLSYIGVTFRTRTPAELYRHAPVDALPLWPTDICASSSTECSSSMTVPPQAWVHERRQLGKVVVQLG